MADRARYYWDTCCFLSLIEGAAIWPNRVPILEYFLDLRDRDLCDIYTSEITTTEAAFAKFEKDKKLLDPAVEKKIDSLYNDVRMIEVSGFVAREARGLIRKVISHPEAHKYPQGLSLRPMDAIHIASAIRRGLSVIHTYDGPLCKFGPMLGIDILRPYPDSVPLQLQNVPNSD